MSSDIRVFFATATEEATPGPSKEVPDNAQPPAAKQLHHCTSGFDRAWPKNFPWVECDEYETGLYCRLCKQYARKPKTAGVRQAVWVDVPCATFTRQSLHTHSSSASHQDTVALEAQRMLTTTTGSISETFCSVETAEKKAIIGAIKCIYWLC